MIASVETQTGDESDTGYARIVRSLEEDKNGQEDGGGRSAQEGQGATERSWQECRYERTRSCTFLSFIRLPPPLN